MSRANRWLVAATLAALTAGATPSRAAPPDGGVPGPLHIEELVRDVSPKNIEAAVRKLAGFQTRHTLSDTTGDEKGIGAARRWIKAELDRISRDNGGRLRV